MIDMNLITLKAAAKINLLFNTVMPVNLTSQHLQIPTFSKHSGFRSGDKGKTFVSLEMSFSGFKRHPL
jgi:hypothetical protein